MRTRRSNEEEDAGGEGAPQVVLEIKKCFKSHYSFQSPICKILLGWEKLAETNNYHHQTIVTYLRMLNVWGGIHRRGARRGRGGGAVEGSNAQTLLSCHCNQPEK